jgi:hypothetical protein
MRFSVASAGKSIDSISIPTVPSLAPSRRWTLPGALSYR